jgi:HTH-type transcriptional regulator / antitoxin HigA
MPIQTDEEHRAALAEIDALWNAPEGTAAGERLDALIDLVVAYEEKRWPIHLRE